MRFGQSLTPWQPIRESCEVITCRPAIPSKQKNRHGAKSLPVALSTMILLDLRDQQSHLGRAKPAAV